MPLDSPGPLASLFSLSSWGRRARYLATLVALSAIATCPGAKARCVAKQRAREAPQLLGYLVDQLRDDVARGAPLPKQAAGPTPAVGACCDQGGACAPSAARWQTPEWQALGFTIDGDSRYSYQYEPDPDGKGATVRAIGDLDCDGVRSTFEAHVAVDGKQVVVTRRQAAPTE